MTAKQIRMVRGLLARLDISDLKEDMAYAYSDNRTVHLSGLTQPETQALVDYLVKESGQQANPAGVMRRKILSMAHEMHWELPDGRVNMERVNNWCLRYSGKNKPLDTFTTLELPTLVSQFEIAYRGFLKGI